MATPILPRDFKDFLRLLHSKEVEYLLVGGYAVSYHGYPRATADIDLWVAIALENVTKVMTVLREFGFDTPELSEALFSEPGRIIRMGLPPFRIELITSASGIDFQECYARRIQTQIDQIPVNIISLEDLKANKKAAGRLKDLADLEYLP